MQQVVAPQQFNNLKPQTNSLHKLLEWIQEKLLATLFWTALVMRGALALIFVLGIISRFFVEYSASWLLVIAGVIIMVLPILIEIAFSLISLSTAISNQFLGKWTVAFYVITFLGFCYNAYQIQEYLDTVKDEKIRHFIFHLLHSINLLSCVLMELVGILYLQLKEEAKQPLPYQEEKEVDVTLTNRTPTAHNAVSAESANSAENPPIDLGNQRIAVSHIVNYKLLGYNDFVKHYSALCGFFELKKAGANISWRKLDAMIGAEGQNGKLSSGLYNHYINVSKKTETIELVDTQGNPIASQTTNISGGAL